MERAGTKSSSSKTGQLILSQTFSIGPLKIRYYGLTMLAAVATAYILGRRHSKEIGISHDTFDDVAFWTIFWGFICARVYYVIFYFDQFRGDLSEIYKVWHGGIAIYGALIGGALALFYQCRKRAVPFLSFADKIVIGIPLAQSIGRLGNFFNYEAFGAPTSLPWKMFVPVQFRPRGFEQYSYFHPTFAYEMIWNLGVFAALLFLNKRYGNFKPGTLILAYVILYSLGRFFIEGVRLDSAFVEGFRVDQIAALFLIIGSLAILLYRYVSQTRQ